ncbi:MAG TPA: hypothetical protein VJH03_15895 [Blastocatellia bacterium]|nr:hypothetical protein [Blastocatellia bacterium]
MSGTSDNHRNPAAAVGASPFLRVPASLAVPFVLIAVFCLGAGAAHEPITTKVRFNKEVIRILQRSCLGCHRPGGIAPMSLASYEEARPWAKAIKEEMLEKRMPPWHAVKGYGEFRNAPSLTQREIDLVVNWVEGGAPKGDDKDLPQGPLYSDDWQLGPPDLVLTRDVLPPGDRLTESRSARNAPQDSDETLSNSDGFRAFLLPTGLKEDRWLRAIDLQRRDDSIVHWAKFYAVKLESGESKDGMDGERTASGPPPDANVVGTWIAGMRTVAFTDGVGHLLPAGSGILAIIHYRGSGDAVRGFNAVGLYFTKAAPRQRLRQVAITNAGVRIPAGAVDHRVVASTIVQDGGEAVAILPAVNPLLISLQATAYRPDGTEEILIWTRGYQFDWQPTYYYKRPVALPKGTRVEVIAYFDNSDGNRNNPNDPPRDQRWSDIAADALCALLVARE